MTLTDKNKIFFALIHYILVEQKNVDWILKTSLIDFTGISSLLEERAYKTDSILDDVVDYITNIKPYHVQFSHYFEHYQTHSEDVKIHVSDWIEPIYKIRFDSMKPESDIGRIFYKPVDSIESATGTEYSVEGMVVYNSRNNKFYIRTVDENNEYHWELIDEPLYPDVYYYSTYWNRYYKSNDTSLEKFTDNDIKEFIDSHRANRLFYIGLHDNDEIKKELNANFKGIEINGGSYDIGKFGYDIFNYDTKEYDSPTVIYDYYFLNKLKYDLNILNPDETIAKTIKGTKSELETYFVVGSGFDTQTEYKGFISTTEERFYIPSFIYTALQNGSKVFAYKLSNGTIKKYDNFEIFRDYIDIFSTLVDKEKIYIIVTGPQAIDPLTDGSEVSSAYIAECSLYTESNNTSLRRSIVYITDEKTDYQLEVPITIEGSTDKVAIQRVTKIGSSTPVLNPRIVDGFYTASLLNFNEYEHVSMVSFDFKYLYDKIYTWEDKYGRSNNVVYLNGNNFYRPRYEDGRPSEMVASSPITSLFVYGKNNNNRYIFFNDFKNQQSNTQILESSYSRITSMDTTVYTETIPGKSTMYDLINSITFDNVDGFDDAPAKVIINSEVILYNNINRNTKTISDLKRGCDGTFLYINGSKNNESSLTHKIGDKAFPIRKDEWIDINRNNVYTACKVRSKNSKVYDCPTGIKKTSTIKVKKISTIKLLEDVDLNTAVIRISSPNVVNKELVNKIENGEIVSGEFYLKINSDTIKFETIYMDVNSNSYCIEDFILPEEYVGYGSRLIYSAEDSIISGCVTEFINDYTVEMVEGDITYDIIVKNDETYMCDESGEEHFRIVGSEIENGELVKLGNVVNVFSTALNDVSNEFYRDEIYFGYIGKDNILYKDDGTIWGKLEDNKVIQVMTQITINDPLEQNDSLYINIHNFKYSSKNSDNW